MEQPLVDAHIVLQKFPGKGGWTYAALPASVRPDRKNPFGWVQVKGRIDGYEISQYKLMPMGQQRLFLPVKAEIRKKIRKQEGDTVHVVLYADESAVDVPAAFLECLRDEPVAEAFFFSLTESQQRQCLKWVHTPLSEAARIERMATAINQLARKQLPGQP